MNISPTGSQTFILQQERAVYCQFGRWIVFTLKDFVRKYISSQQVDFGSYFEVTSQFRYRGFSTLPPLETKLTGTLILAT